MRKALIGALGVSLTAGFLAAVGSPALASPDDGRKPITKPAATVADNLPNPLADKQTDLRKAALADVLSGRKKAVMKNGSAVVKVGQQRLPLTAAEKAKVKAGAAVKARTKDQYVEVSRESTDRIFVVLAEFGNQRHPNYPDRDTDPDTEGPTTFDGPLHNKIPEPDRSKDNSTIWQADYSAEHYRQLYFGEGKGVESLKTYYEKQSSGRYSVDGEVTDWVKVPYNEARYGRSDGYPCASNVCTNTWALLADALTAWVADQKAAGRTDAEIQTDVKSFDQRDRYDFDGDGNFNEPDGYIDHFQIVHAGGDQADGDPQQGEDAIWSHRWYAFQGNTTGPATNKRGGTQIGNTGIWVGDYTIQPENGGLSVFAHEYGHDLGLPDLYDGGAGGDSTVGFWSLMAQSRLKAKGDVGIGTRPGDLGAWDKLQLGWLDYETALAGEKLTYQLGPHEYNSAKAQGLVVVLPKKQVTTNLAPPFAGTKTWWSGTGDNRTATMSRNVTLPATAATLSLQTRYNIEDCGPDPCDDAFVEVNDGSGWKPVPDQGNVITIAAEGNAINGAKTAWTKATFDLSAYAGKQIGVRVRYTTDPATAGNEGVNQVPGIFVDAISIDAGGTNLFADGAENGANGWTLSGFSAVGATQTTAYDNYYIASNRTYTSYDRYLKTGPYNFGWATTRPDWTENFPYQNGLLISYWDTSQADNNVSAHPGEGEILPIDAHPRPLFRLDGQAWRGRVALYDATFGLERADTITLHVNGQANYIRGQEAQPLFDDTTSYYDTRTPYTSVKVRNAGVTIRVLEQSGTSMKIRLGSKTPAAKTAATR